MPRHRGRTLQLVLLLALTACSVSYVPPPAEPDPEPGPTRSTWKLRHAVRESDELKIVGYNLGHYDESTGVSLRARTQSCFVSVSAPEDENAGPERMTGQKVPTTVRGRPGFRNGAGAEMAYLMWQLKDQSWVTTSCDDPQDSTDVDRVAKALEFKPSSVRLPFSLRSLPEKFGVAVIQQDLVENVSKVYVGRIRPQFGHAEADFIIVYDPSTENSPPRGRSVTVNGRSALLDARREYVGLCILVQPGSVCVATDSGDTGPNPDRSGDQPVVQAMADALVLPSSLTDRTTWFPAEQVFG